MFGELTPLAVLLACAFGWAGLDLLRKFVAVRGRALPMAFLMVAVQLPLFGAWALADGSWRIAPGYWWPGLGAIAVNLLANLTYMQSVRLSPMSATLPLLSLTPVFTTVLAVPMLGERPGAVEGLGIVIVVAGALGLNFGRSSPEDGTSGSLLAVKGAPWMVATAALWALSPPLDKLAIRHATPGLHVLIMGVGIVLGLWILLLSLGRLGEVRGIGAGTWKLILAAALVSSVALFFQLWAIQILRVGLMETVKRGVGAVMALLLGRLFFAEKLSGRKLAAVLTMVAGVALVLM